MTFRIAVNGLPLMAVHTGIARYLTSLYAEISKATDVSVEYVTLCSMSRHPPLGATSGGLTEKIISMPPQIVNMIRSAHWLAYEKYAAHVTRRQKIHILHESFYTPSNIKKSTAQVFTLHDLSLVNSRDTHSLDRRLFFERFFANRIHQADHIIVPTNHVKNEFEEYIGRNVENVSVIHEGVTPFFFPRRPKMVQAVLQTKKLPSEYILFVGTMDPRKNLTTLLNALPQTKNSISLVIAGWRGWGDAQFNDYLDKLKLRSRVYFPGYVTDEELACLYSGATGFLYPSLYEGFGLPILEAMACGCPVISSNTTSLPEVAGDAALLIDPNVPEKWADAIDHVCELSALREGLINAGIKRSKQFTWNTAAHKTLKLFRSLA